MRGWIVGVLVLASCNNVLGLKGGWKLAGDDAGIADGPPSVNPDAHVTVDDAAVADAAVELRDAARPPDASRPDAFVADAALPDAFVPLRPPLVDDQAADLVIGQTLFTTITAGSTLASLNGATSVASAADHIWVFDAQNARVLQWDSPPLTNGVAANHTIGSVTGGIDFQRVFSDGTHLFVSDTKANRVWIYDQLPTVDDETPSLVLGQINFTDTGSGTELYQLNQPIGIWSDGKRLIVVDKGNNRVLIWNEMPTENGQPADLTLGGTAGAPSASTMSAPFGVLFDGKRLFVADYNDNRVMVWNGMPTKNAQPADYFIGQSGPTDVMSNAGGGLTPNAAGLEQPTAMIVAWGSLFVADSGNSRVMVFTPVPTSSGPSANVVLGQKDFTSIIGSAGPVSASTVGAYDLAVDGKEFYVADFIGYNGIAGTENRVLRFTLSP